ncbi:ABC-type polysaccharide/polyol phosphate export permease [Tistlia consotensis]|uniref:ABC-type polysaccharide/polyol phosphate export permease n=1 Tax=Tistlia consotensis USBA 355 TaxID=560819 RepID=A0A1Y6B8W7_9PROT|nr:ABC transporter permease [Tistlia consotensis]SME99045.1 ABC-type polysaccharide/polyol phosphate export permease [Tistlia consotensis USBA 355]SNR77457.1 ABC-type polysaccharide/polyol phosphate export permease [Tistlia consotensis]
MTGRRRRPVRRTVVRPVARNLFVYLRRTLQARRIVLAVAQILFARMYQQTILGPFWLLVRAALPTLGIALVFQHVGSFQSKTIPYPLYLFSGMALWSAVHIGLLRGVRSLSHTRRIHGSINTPRLTMVLGSLVIPVFYHLVFVAILAALLAWYWATGGALPIAVGWNLGYAPLAVALTLLLIAGLSAVSSVIFLVARDVRFVLPLLVQVWFLATPVVYPLDMLPPVWRSLSLFGNPMTAICGIYRHALFGAALPDSRALLAATTISLAVFLLGSWAMMRSDRILHEIV